MKIACITGDVHHDLGRSQWSRHEPAFALEYARVINEKDVKGTLFITGKCAKRSDTFIRVINNLNCMEIGGHTYQAFQILPTILPQGGFKINYKGEEENIDLRHLHHSLSSIIIDSFYGPLWYQKWNIKRTVRALEEIGITPTSWRTHRYASDDRTYSALDSQDFFVVSDIYDDEFQCYQETGDLWHATIVGPGDDEMVRPESDNKEYRRQLLEYIERASKRNEPVLLQMHPKRQAMIGFDFLRKVIDYLGRKDYDFMTITNMVSELTGESPTDNRS